MRGALRWLSTVLIMAGVLLVADAVLTVAWQEPLSAVMAQRSQHELADQLEELRQEAPTELERKALASLPDSRRRIAYAAKQLRRTVKPGQAIGRIAFPTLDKRYVMIAGDDPAELRKGPGVYPERSLPGQGATTAVAGHRTTYGAPFRDVNELERNDRIVVEMPYGTFTYVVQGTKIVKPTDLSVIDDVGYDRLVLTACHPLYSAAERIVVFARLDQVVPTRRISDLGADGRRR